MIKHKPSETSRIGQRMYYKGVEKNGFSYKENVPATNGITYAVRSVNYGSYDILAGFQVVRKDDIDGSLILKWKVLKKFPKVDFKGD